MTDRDRHILEEFAQRVRYRFPEAIVRAFGSRALGQAAPDSDLDVCVVVDKLDDEGDRAIMRAAWEVGFAADTVISTVTFSSEEFASGPVSCSPIVQTIRREGVAA